MRDRAQIEEPLHRTISKVQAKHECAVFGKKSEKIIPTLKHGDVSLDACLKR